MMKSKMCLYALHGFLGLPSDWTHLFKQMSTPLIDEIHAVDLFVEDPVALNVWGRNLKVPSTSGPRILLGYSLGGRLAMHALLGQTSKWDAAVMISAHPGLSSDEE